MPYRWAPPAAVDDGPEHAAILSLAASAARVRRVVLTLGAVGGLVSAVAGYLALRELQLAMYGLHFPWLTATVGGTPFLWAWLRSSRRLGDSIVRRRAPKWIEELVGRYRVPLATLDEYKDLI